jgi:hypothetical protein
MRRRWPRIASASGTSDLSGHDSPVFLPGSLRTTGDTRSHNCASDFSSSLMLLASALISSEISDWRPGVAHCEPPIDDGPIEVVNLSNDVLYMVLLSVFFGWLLRLKLLEPPFPARRIRVLVYPPVPLRCGELVDQDVAASPASGVMRLEHRCPLPGEFAPVAAVLGHHCRQSPCLVHAVQLQPRGLADAHLSQASLAADACAGLPGGADRLRRHRAGADHGHI